MANWWIFLVLGTVFQTVYTLEDDEFRRYSTEEFDTNESTSGLNNVIELLDSFYIAYCNKNRDMQIVLKTFLSDYCGHPEDVSDYFVCDSGNALRKYKLLKELKNHLDAAEKNVTKDQDELETILLKTKAYYCKQIYNEVEDDGDETRIDFGKILGKITNIFGGKVKQKLKESAKSIMKTGIRYIKKNAVKMEEVICTGNTCSTCISITLPLQKRFCLEFSISREENLTTVHAKVTIDDEVKLDKDIKLGNIPSCVHLFKLLGNICLKGIEGKGAKGDKINFCLGVVVEKLGVGVKFCATNESGKLKMKVEPGMFPGVNSGDQLLEHHDEEYGAELDAAEFDSE